MKLGRTAKVLIVLAVAAGGAELGARLVAAATLRERGMRYDAELGFRPVPNVRKHDRFWGDDEPATTNSHGWRDAEHAYEKEPGVTRAVALGDSFTFGVEVDYGERFTEILEGTLAAFEVVNLGVNAYGTAQELRALEVHGVRYDPDLVILVAYLGNDLDDVRNVEKGGQPCPWYRLEDGELELVPPSAGPLVRLRNASYVVETVLGMLSPGEGGTREAPQWAGDVDTVPLFVALVRRMAEVCDEAGARFLAVYTYSSDRFGFAPFPRELRARQLVADAGIATLDTFAAFAESIAAGAELFERGHWSPEGHRLVAELIRRELLERGWVE